MEIVVDLLKMDAVRNPYTARSGSRPPVLAGRTPQLTAFGAQLKRLRQNQPTKNLLLTGLHSVGKTALLTVFEGMAEDAGFCTAAIEITRETAFVTVVERLVRRARISLQGAQQHSRKVGSAASAPDTLCIRPAGRSDIDKNIYTNIGRLDSEQLVEVSDQFVTLGRTAVSVGKPVVFLLDEIQLLGPAEFEALTTAAFECCQRHLPVMLVGAGLPKLPTLPSGIEEAFDLAVIDRLQDAEACSALEIPAETLGARFQSEAASRIVGFSCGYPYFLQEYGKHVWNLAQGEAITVDDVENAHPIVQMHLDDNFFRTRIARATAVEVAYLRAMADLDIGPYRSGEIAVRLGRPGSEAVAPIRARLMEKGLIYSPRYGLNEFTMPQFTEFLRRNYRLDLTGAR